MHKSLRDSNPIERIDSGYLDGDQITIIDEYEYIAAVPLNVARDMIDSGKYRIVNKITIAPK
jgi:hypothetical protein